MIRVPSAGSPRPGRDGNVPLPGALPGAGRPPLRSRHGGHGRVLRRADRAVPVLAPPAYVPGRYEVRLLIFDPSHTSGSYLRSTARSFRGISALSVILMPSGQTSVQHLVMLQ